MTKEKCQRPQIGEWDDELNELWARDLSTEEFKRYSELFRTARCTPPESLWYKLQAIPKGADTRTRRRRLPSVPRLAVATAALAVLAVVGYKYEERLSRARIYSKAEHVLQSLVRPELAADDIFDGDVLRLGSLQ